MAINLDEVLAKDGVSTEGIEIGNQPVQKQPEQETPNEQSKEVFQERQEIKQEIPVKEEIKQEVKEEVKQPENPFAKYGDKIKSWDDVDKLLQKAEQSPFKDDYIRKVAETYEAKGSLEDFFKAHSTDWKAMSPEEVLKNKISEQYAGIDKKHIDKIWQKEKAKYGLDPDENTEDEIELGMALMERDANMYREEKIKAQEGYFQPKPEPVDVEKIRQTVANIPSVKTLLDSKKLSYKIGDKDFNVEVKDPSAVMETLVDERNFINQFIKPDGTADVEAWIDVVSYAQNREGVRQALIDFGRQMGKVDVIDTDYKNTDFKKTAPEQDSGDFQEGLLKAFLKTGKI